jgi:hypothetical protein
MDRDAFWKIMEQTRSADADEQANAIVSILTKVAAEEIVDFERHMGELLAATYSWDVWGAAYLMRGGCSDDGFDYFRGWLIGQGKAIFEATLADPDSLADVPDLDDDAEGESLLYVAFRAHDKVVGTELPRVRIDLPELGEEWDFDDDDEMRKRYPKLFTMFGE